MASTTITSSESPGRALSADVFRTGNPTSTLFDRDDRQMLVSGSVAMLVLFGVGSVLAWLAISAPAEVEAIGLSASVTDDGEGLLVWQAAESTAEVVLSVARPASQLAVLSQTAAGPSARGILPSLDLQIAAPQASSAGGQVGAPLTGINDPFNPTGVGLARAGMFQGRTLLAWTNEPYVVSQIFPEEHAVWQALRLLGFDVQLRTGPFEPHFLEGVSQVWIFAGRRSGMTETDYRAVINFLHAGGGLYLCGDNVPYLAESKRLCSLLFHCQPTGDYFGEKLLGIRGRHGEVRRLQGPQGEIRIQAKNWQDRHPLLTGMQCIFEGHTISTLPASSRLTPVLRASNQRILAAASKGTLRVVIDGGFTRYDPAYNLGGTEKEAGTLLWATNIATYLEEDGPDS